MEQKMHFWKNTINQSLYFSFFISLLTFILCYTSSCTSTVDTNNTAHKQQHENTKNAWNESNTTIVGRALGTTFIIKSGKDPLLATPREIDGLFNAFNAELSTYIDTSLISQFNNQDTLLDLNSTLYFKPCFELSQEIFQKTEGAFDPTVYPLVSLWGFFKTIDNVPNQEEIDSVLAFVGFENKLLFHYENGILTKHDPHFKLVFNAIAKGQSVDVIADFLDNKGQENYFIEVGGEIRVKGVNEQGAKWVIGIDEPSASNTGMEGAGVRSLENYIEVTNRAVATSGNYRDFYELEGRKYSHTISPITGKPVRHNLLSATVISHDAASADAYATAFMVMGVEKTLALIKENPEWGVDAYLLFDGGKGRIERAYSRGMLQYLMD